MKTLTEKYQALKKGKYSKKQFLREARLAHPTLITQFNAVEDAISILKNKGLVYEANEDYKVFSSEEELDAFIDTQVEKDKMASEDGIDFSEYIVFDNNTFYIGRTDSETGEEIVEPGQEIEFEYEGKTYKATVTDQEVGRDGDNLVLALHPEPSINEANEAFEIDILDTISLNQVKKGIRYELEEMGVKGVKVSAKDWSKAKDKVRKNIEKDQNYYVHKLANVKPVKDEKRADTMKTVPLVKNKDVSTAKGQKKVKDQFNQMEKVKLTEIKRVIKKVILESLGEQEYSMPPTSFKEELSPEAYDRMEGISNIKAQEAVKKGSGVIIRELEEEGFEAVEILEFIVELVKANYGINIATSISLNEEENIFSEQEIKDLEEGADLYSVARDIVRNADVPTEVLQSEDQTAKLLQYIQDEWYQMMADHFAHRAGAAPDELEEQANSRDEVANKEFGTDYDRLGKNEKEWVRVEIENLKHKQKK